MNSEIIKNKLGDESMWNQPGFPEGFDKFIKEKTSSINEVHQPWNYKIPLNELNINITKVEQPVFVYNGRVYQSQIRKAPLLRTHELNKNFSNLEDNSQIKKDLEDFINNNFTHIYQVIEERMASFVGDNRVMNQVTYIIRGVKINIESYELNKKYTEGNIEYEYTKLGSNTLMGISYRGDNDPVIKIDEFIRNKISNKDYTEFIDTNMDNPFVRIIVIGDESKFLFK
jgi:hypothetical protein